MHPNPVPKRSDSRRLRVPRLLFAAPLLLLAAFGVRADEPSYEDTLVFIEGNARYPLAEREQRCEFIYRENFRFSAKDLNPVSEVNGWGVTLKCLQGKKCIDPRNSNTLASSLTIDVKDIKNGNKVSRALAHLIQLCGGAKAKPDLF